MAEKDKGSPGTKRRGSRPAAPAVVSITTQGGPFKGVSTAVVRRRASKMLAHLALQGVELSVALVNDEAIHELNRTYRRKDKPTDVLAFPMLEQNGATSRKRGRRGPVDPSAWHGLLGDVIVSIDTAARQAAERDRPLLDEITMLLGHGLLHLLGYDHKTDAEEREMTALTRELEAAAASRGSSPTGIRPRSGVARPNKTGAQ
ncbi:rRNA maturation RNase YbeY [Sorangium cellulosum]|uniref:Endoribonuclease YbeY n=1 Tax=Sorangium cellulosum TaxID=56 RepID=A0A150PKJ7_SORCE|nr:rRNA maturation RNase YbeY [Sorangium cellulosum]KYF87673.1 rRNA maturation RNase YbeY [Sorangium cellulosum]KYG00910.1 rRNA maturation RNase YbeY [Sorangium cellulosum]KYG08244.1 rRNA maturation RNase YbeY [Sorangium cellulosum]